MHRPPDQSLVSLHEHGVPSDVVDIACVMTSCILAAAEDVAADTRDESYDDATSRGGLLYRRAHNRVLADLKADERAVLDRTDNALHVRIGGVAVSFYAARNGLDFPNLDGSVTKRNVVDEMQMVLNVGEPELRRLVLMHESDDDGAVRVALGVMDGARSWAWRATMYDRYASEDATATEPPSAAYDQLPEPELPPMRRRDQDVSAAAGEQ